MPKKIKEKKEVKLGEKEKLLNVDNVHVLFIIIGIISLAILVFVGIFVSREDKYHAHKDNAIVSFQYNEKLNEGYNNYALMEMDNKQVSIEFVNLDIQDVKNISRKKFLDFNEEIYNTGILDIMLYGQDTVTDSNWSLYIELADGTKKYIYADALPSDDTTMNERISSVRKIVEKYFGHETLYN